MHPVFLIDIDPEDPETEVNYNALVDFPAHMRGFHAYGKEKTVNYFVQNEEKMRVTGVMIAEGTPIYREDNQLGKHYVIFTKEAIERMWLDFHKKAYNNNVNEMHDGKKKITPGAKGIYMIQDWIIDEELGQMVPAALAHQEVREGSWVSTYQIEDKKIWAKVKDGTFNGFSVEGIFIKYPAQVKKVDPANLKMRAIIRELYKRAVQ